MFKFESGNLLYDLVPVGQMGTTALLFLRRLGSAIATRVKRRVFVWEAAADLESTGRIITLQDQKAEILSVRRPPALAVGWRCRMRLMQI
jgi:hypothetical protein